jgi:hypothetical protein
LQDRQKGSLVDRRSTDGFWGYHTCLEGGAGRADSGRSAFKISVFVAEITDEFILGLYDLRANDASVDFGRHMLRMGCEEVSLWRPGARPRSSGLHLASDGTRGPLETAKGLVEPTTSHKKEYTLTETKIGRLLCSNGWSGGTIVTITLLFTFIMILLTVRLPTPLEQTKSVCATICLSKKNCIMLETVRGANKIITFEVSVRFIT